MTYSETRQDIRLSAGKHFRPPKIVFFKTQLYMVNTGRSAKSCIILIFKKCAAEAYSGNINSSASRNSLRASESFKLHFLISAKTELQIE